MENYSQNHPEIIQKIIKKHGWRTVQKKRKNGSRWGPFGLPFGTPGARLDSLGVPFGPPSHSNLAFVAIRALLCATDPEKTPT